MKKILKKMAIALPFGLLAYYLPTTPLDFHWILGYFAALAVVDIK